MSEHVTLTPPTATVEDVQDVRQAKALLELRELARAFDSMDDQDARRILQDALHHKIDLALGNGATMRQIAMILSDGAGVEADNARTLRTLATEVRGGGVTGFSPTGFDTVDEVLPTLRLVVRDNTRLVDELTAKADELAQLKADVAAMRRVLGVAAD